MLKGENVNEAKLVVDKIKGILEETSELLDDSRNEIFSFLLETRTEASTISENLVNALKFIRSIYSSTEQRYRETTVSV